MHEADWGDMVVSGGREERGEKRGEEREEKRKERACVGGRFRGEGGVARVAPSRKVCTE